MKILNYFFLFTLVTPMSGFSKTIVRVNPLGESLKGQFIAYEEYGYMGEGNLPFVKLKIMNVWKNKYVEEFKLFAEEDQELSEIRREIKGNSEKLFAKYSIRPLKSLRSFKN